MKHPPWITIAAIAYGAWAARSLLNSWEYAPFELYGWVILLVWSLPALLGWSTSLSGGQTKGVAAALGITTLGILASVNTIKQAGLAMAIVSLVPWSWHSLAWLVCACSWMPAIGWELVHLFPNICQFTMLISRIIIAFFGIAMMWRRSGYGQHS